MPPKNVKLLRFSQHHKTIKTPATIYTDLECFIRKNGCKNNPIKPSTTKVGEYIPCGCSIFTIWSYNGIKTKHDICRRIM